MVKILTVLAFTVSISVHAQTVQKSSLDEMRKYFSLTNKRVVTLIGFYGSEYEDKNAMLLKVHEILASYDPKTTIVNIRATPEGIGAAYEVAKELGFQTTGVVSSQAEKYGVKYSKFVDRVFVITDENWGGFAKKDYETYELSPTSDAVLNVSHDVFTIGGDEVGAVETKAARAFGKKVTFIPADMNHQRAISEAAKKGQPAPTDFRGAAYHSHVPTNEETEDFLSANYVFTPQPLSPMEKQLQVEALKYAPSKVFNGLTPGSTVAVAISAGQGYGDIISNLEMIDRLKSVYPGVHFNVFFEEISKDKIANLIPSFDPSKDIQKLEDTLFYSTDQLPYPSADCLLVS